MLGHRQHRRDVVAGVRVIRGQKRIVEIEFADRDAIGPRRPFRLITLAARQPEDPRALCLRMRFRLRAR